MIRQAISKLTAAGYAPETVAKTMRWVRLTLNQAVRDRRIPYSPTVGISLPRTRTTEMRILEPADIIDIAELLPDRYQALPIVAAYTGMRWGELAGLTVDRVDLCRVS